MTKSSRRKKAKPVKNRRLTFKISVEAQEMTVSYHPRRMGDMGQFEFRSPHKPPRRIPISETGYYCHFAPMEDVNAAKSPQVFAREAALALLPWRRTPKRPDSAELPLF
jgi:hypothetical protein